jgi:DNA invertase Pin-like site-specific DNA recombinase
MSRRAALYLRVSTLDQNTDNQEIQLREAAGRAGYEITKVYRDHGISGAKGRDQRPQFDALCKDAARRKFDLIMSWSVDRLGRSLTDLLEFLKEIHALRIDLYLHQQGLDTTTPSGKAMFQMMGVFAELERSLIRERVRAGLARAKASGVRLGRPRVAADKETRIRELLRQGIGIVRIGKTVGCGTGVVQRIRADLIAGKASARESQLMESPL